ncbi:hypothetical protein HY522_04165 [bacterium]|nr:hypothetical protein [bacterium]
MDGNSAAPGTPNLPIERLNLPPRAYRCLKSAGLHTVESVLRTPLADILALRNFGAGSMKILARVLRRMGYRWQIDRRPPDLAAILGMDIAQVGFSDTLVECLHLAQIERVGELATRQARDLLRYPQIGPRRLKIIRHVLNDLGLDLGMDLILSDAGRWVDRLDHIRETLRARLKTPADEFFFAQAAGLRHRTLKKFLGGDRLTAFVRDKFKSIVPRLLDPETPFDWKKHKPYRELMRAKSAYEETGSLKRAARKLGMSHEKIRILLKLGATLRL